VSEERKTQKHYREVYERIIKFIDDSDLLQYARVDVQVLNGKKNYFQAVAVKSACEDDGSGRNESGKRRTLYICTQNSKEGTKTIEALPKAWLKRFIEMMRDPAFMDDLPLKMKGLAADSIEELELKMGILGI